MKPPPVPPLRTLIFHVTKRCNLRCRHCWQSTVHDECAAGHDGDKNGLLPSEFGRAVKDAKALGLSAVKFTGGEPFLHSRMMDYLIVVSREGLEVVIETNGTLLDESQVVKFKTLRVKEVALSLDGAEAATHDVFRGLDGAYARTLNALKLLARHKLPVQLIMCLHRGNVAELEDMVRLAAEYKAGTIKMNPIQPMGRGRELAQREECLEVVELLEAAEYCRRKLANLFSGKLRFHLPIAFRPFVEIQDRRFSVCQICSILGLLPNGDLSFCGVGQTNPELVTGNIYQDQLSDVWHRGPLFDKLRRCLPNRLKGVCARCLLKHICLGECRAVAYDQTGDLMSSYWICQQALEAGLFPASRLLPDFESGVG